MDTLAFYNSDGTDSISSKEILQCLSLSSSHISERGKKADFFFFFATWFGKADCETLQSLHSSAKKGHLSSANRI